MEYGDVMWDSICKEQDELDAKVYVIESMSDDEFDFVYDEVSFVYECKKTGIIIDGAVELDTGVLIGFAKMAMIERI